MKEIILDANAIADYIADAMNVKDEEAIHGIGFTVNEIMIYTDKVQRFNQQQVVDAVHVAMKNLYGQSLPEDYMQWIVHYYIEYIKLVGFTGTI